MGHKPTEQMFIRMTLCVHSCMLAYTHLTGWTCEEIQYGAHFQWNLKDSKSKHTAQTLESNFWTMLYDLQRPTLAAPPNPSVTARLQHSASCFSPEFDCTFPVMVMLESTQSATHRCLETDYSEGTDTDMQRVWVLKHVLFHLYYSYFKGLLVSVWIFRETLSSTSAVPATRRLREICVCLELDMRNCAAFALSLSQTPNCWGAHAK